MPFLKSAFTEAQQTWLMGSAVACNGSPVELAGKGCGKGLKSF